MKSLKGMSLSRAPMPALSAALVELARLSARPQVARFHICHFDFDTCGSGVGFHPKTASGRKDVASTQGTPVCEASAKCRRLARARELAQFRAREQAGGKVSQSARKPADLMGVPPDFPGFKIARPCYIGIGGPNGWMSGKPWGGGGLRANMDQTSRP